MVKSGMVFLLFWRLFLFYFPHRPVAFSTLLQLFGSQGPSAKAEEDPDAGITAIDYEEQTAGYQVAYSRLIASEAVKADPVSYAGDPKQYLIKTVAQAVQRTGGSTWKGLIQRCQPDLAQGFVQEYLAAGQSF
jgi:exportin-2 (importin alpha re-exporter)